MKNYVNITSLQKYTVMNYFQLHSVTFNLLLFLNNYRSNEIITVFNTYIYTYN